MNNTTNFSRYRWVKKLVMHRLAHLGYTEAEIKAAVQHAISLLANGYSAAYALYTSTRHAARLRADTLILPYHQPPHSNGPGAAS